MTTHYLPHLLPIPALSITLSAPGERPWLGPMAVILDTGADMTLMPAQLLRQLRVHPLGEGRLRGPWGDTHDVTLYLIDVQVSQLLLPDVQVASDEAAEDVILGRNVLNKLPLFLDGPQQQTEVLDDATVQRLRARR